VDNIKMHLTEIGWGGFQDRDQWRAFVNTVMNLRDPQNVGQFLISCVTGGFSTRAQLHGVSQLVRTKDIQLPNRPALKYVLY
jgi:hypothetical protein